MQNRILTAIINRGYTLIRTDNSCINLLLSKEHMIILIDVQNGMNVTPEFFTMINNVAVGFLQKRGIQNCDIIKLIFTDNVAKVRESLYFDNSYWIIDTISRRLMVYEDQPYDFGGLRTVIEDAALGKLTKPKRTLRDMPIVTLALIAVNIIYFIVIYANGGFNNVTMVELGAAFTPYITQYGEYYRIFTSMFMHFGIEHLISNMLALMVLGEALERYVGKIRFLIIYLLSGIIGGIVSVASYALRDRMVVSAGASGAVFGVLGAILVVTIFGHIRSGEVRIEPRRLIMFALLSILSGFNDTGIDNYAHIGGLVSGIIIALIMVLITDRYKSAK